MCQADLFSTSPPDSPIQRPHFPPHAPVESGVRTNEHVVQRTPQPMGTKNALRGGSAFSTSSAASSSGIEDALVKRHATGGQCTSQCEGAFFPSNYPAAPATVSPDAQPPYLSTGLLYLCTECLAGQRTVMCSLMQRGGHNALMFCFPVRCVLCR